MSGFNVNSFIANGLKQGGARPSLFSISLTPPAAINGSAAQIEVLANAASLPGSTIQEVDVPYFGRKIKLSGDRTFDSWTISVMNDEDFAIRALFENWHNTMNTLVSNRLDVGALGGMLGYKVPALVKQYSKAGPGTDAGIIRSYVFSGMFPTNVEPITLDWNQVNAIETFNVTLAYDWYEPDTQTSGSYSGTLADDSAS